MNAAGFVIAATLVLALTAGTARFLFGRSSEAQRLVLLGGIVTTPMLPLAMVLGSSLSVRLPAVLCDAGPATASMMDRPLGSLAWALWLAGSVLMILQLLRHAFAVRHWRKAATSLREPDVSFVCQTLCITRDEVTRRFRTTPSGHTPMVLAGKRQVVLLPCDWSGWSPALRRSALRHEWRHLLACDAQWSVVCAVLRACLWFHPLVWWVCARWAEQCEHLADRAAATGRPAADYAEDLLALAGASRQENPAFATAFLPSTRSRLTRRVCALLDDTPHGRPCGRIANAVVVMAFAIVGMTLAVLLATKMKPHTADLELEARTRMQANPFPGDQR